jgi:LuxR family transcriptional regulator
MKRIQRIDLQLQRLVAVPDWSFAVGLRVRFNHPTLLYQTYPEEWIAHYARNGLLFVDPAVGWGMTNTGICDWKDLAAADAAGVLEQAAGYGLLHGIVVSVGDVTTRSLGFFASAKAPIAEHHRSLAQDVVLSLHDETAGMTELPPSDLAPYIALNDALRSAPTA